MTGGDEQDGENGMQVKMVEITTENEGEDNS